MGRIPKAHTRGSITVGLKIPRQGLPRLCVSEEKESMALHGWLSVVMLRVSLAGSGHAVSREGQRYVITALSTEAIPCKCKGMMHVRR